MIKLGERWFCGCCGRGPIDELEEWCADCKTHVLGHGPLCERTYFAQHRRLCPFEINDPQARPIRRRS